MNLKIGTFNCQGIRTSAAKQQMLVNNFKPHTAKCLHSPYKKRIIKDMEQLN